MTLIGLVKLGLKWRTAFYKLSQDGKLLFRVALGRARSYGKEQIFRSQVILGRGILGQAMIDWLKKEGLLGHAWEEHQQDMITSDMLQRWDIGYKRQASFGGLTKGKPFLSLKTKAKDLTAFTAA